MPETVTQIKCAQECTLVHASNIIIDKDRGRKDFSHVPELMESIKKIGLINPILVSPIEDQPGKFKLIAGESRFRALMMLCQAMIPVTTRTDMDPMAQKSAELEENLKRKELSWPEQCALLDQLNEIKKAQHGAFARSDGETTGWTQEKTASLVGESPQSVGAKIKIAKLLKDRPDIKEKIIKLPMKVAIKEADRLLENERLERLASQGKATFNASLQQIDAREFLKSLESNSVDLLVTDPPFGIEELNEDETKDWNGSSQNYKATLKTTDNLDLDSAASLLDQVVPEIYRVLKPSSHAYFFISNDLYPSITTALRKAGFIVDPALIIWDKGRSTAPFRGYDYAPCYEPIVHCHKPPREKRLAQAATKILRFAPTPVKERRHAFQKPQELLQCLIRQSSKLGDVVLDCFAGSGSTLVAAMTLGRSAIGCEIDRDNYLNAQKVLSTLRGDESTGRVYCKHDNNPLTCKLCEKEKAENDSTTRSN